MTGHPPVNSLVGYGHRTEGELLSRQRQGRFYANLAQQTNKLEHSHQRALSAAALEHERVRHGVEVERQLLEARLQAERQRREAEALHEAEQARLQQQKLDDQRQRELQQRERQQQERQQQERQQAEEVQRRLTNERRIHKDKESQIQVEARKQAADEQRRREEQQSRERRPTAEVQAKVYRKADVPALNENSVPPQTKASQPVLESPSIIGAVNSELEQDHTKYLTIHKRLKELRSLVVKEARNDAALKSKLGDMRRQITKSVGQLTDGRGANRQPLSNILIVLKDAAKMSKPAVNPNQYMANAAPNDGNGSGVLVYLLNIVSKAVISQFINEASVSPKAADPVGIIVSHIFALDEFKWQGTSLIDIFLAKYHVVCPALFGIIGSEKTAEGRHRLGWWREDPGGPFVTEQRHFERMTGLSAGFAALSLRNYEKSKLENPFPSRHYWSALAQIANIPPAQLTQTHFVVLKALIQGHEVKFIGIFGGASLALLQRLVIQLPQLVTPSVASRSFAGMVDLLARQEILDLRTS